MGTGKFLNNLEIVLKPVAELIPYANNARTHSDAQVAQIAESIKEFGFNNPILLDGENGIIAGHGRVLAARKLNLEKVPCVELKHLTPSQKRAYILADNKIAENAEWDYEILKLELDELKINYDISALGFDEGDKFTDINFLDEKYSKKIDSIQYEPNGKHVQLSECTDFSKTEELINEINESDLSDDEKEFLISAANRHTVFNYSKIADYYANDASPNMQKLMQKSALVIIDFDDAIENGFIKLKESIINL